jgi:hypothetical protein
VQVPLSAAARVPCDNREGVGILRRGKSAERHREPAFRRPPAPGPGNGFERLAEVGVNLGVREELQPVAVPVQAVARLPHLADAPPLQRERPRVKDRLVAEVERPEAERPIHGLRLLATCQHRDPPAHPARIPDERLHRVRAILGRTDRVAGDEPEVPQVSVGDETVRLEEVALVPT